MARWIAVGLVLGWMTTVVAGCSDGLSGDDDDVSDDDVADDDDDTGPIPGDGAAGVLDIAEMYNEGGGGLNSSSQIVGLLADGPAPTVHRVTMEQGDCVYYELRPGFCDPPCDAGEVCNANDVCEPYPIGVSAGTLTISGLGDPIVIEPEEWTAGRYYGPLDLPDDLFDAGTVVTAHFAGDQLPAMTLEAVGVETMDTAVADEEFVIVQGQDNVFTWTPGPDPDAAVEIVINSYNAAHGAPLTDVIHCVGDDDGEMTIPQAMVDAFPLDEIPTSCIHFDCPPSELTRYSTSAVDTGGLTIILILRSTTYFMGGAQLG